MNANDARPAAVVLHLSTDLTARLHRWIDQQPDPKPGLAEAVVVLLDEQLSAKRGDAVDDPNSAGGAAFETYGDAGRPINPHEPGTRDRGTWDDGFETAKKERMTRLKPVGDDPK